MPDPDKVAAVVHEWAGMAENDLRAAVHLLKLGRQCPTEVVCFHAQQCVEKYLKALLVLAGIDFPRTHDLEQLTSLLPPRFHVPLTDGERAELTDYAVGARYPGAGEIPMRDARLAIAIARRVRSKARALLPHRPSRRRDLRS